MADWHAARARSAADLARAKELLTWVARHALPSGVLAEQVHPETGDPLSVSPLTWSHAAFEESVQRYYARHAELTVTKRPSQVRARRRTDRAIRVRRAATTPASKPSLPDDGPAKGAESSAPAAGGAGKRGRSRKKAAP